MVDTMLLAFGAFVAAAISGAAGFGGALLLLPLLTNTVGAREAVPLLTIAQIVGNLSRMGFGFREIRWRSVLLFLSGALPFCILGALSFVHLPKAAATRCIGTVILVLVALSRFHYSHLGLGPLFMVGGGAFVGFVSGLAGSGGPLGAAIFLTLGLPPVAYVASEATTALAMHAAKMAVYGRFISLDQRFWFLAGVLGLAMALGTWVAKRAIEHCRREVFKRYITILLVGIGVWMLIL